MAEGAQRVLERDGGIAATGVAGPDEQDGQPVGTVWFALPLPKSPWCGGVSTRLPGDRERIPAVLHDLVVLNILRRGLDAFPLP